MLMSYGQNEETVCVSIDINALRAKRKPKFKQILILFESSLMIL